MEGIGGVPSLAQVVLDTTDVRGLAEFYRQLLGYEYRQGDEIPKESADDADWLVLSQPSTGKHLAFQLVDQLRQTTWPDDEVPQQLHLDMTVPDKASLDLQHERVLGLGGRLLYDRSHDQEEPLRVYADPAGHPFCIFVAGDDG